MKYAIKISNTEYQCFRAEPSLDDIQYQGHTTLFIKLLVPNVSWMLNPYQACNLNINRTVHVMAKGVNST